jgi:hypothetical protein
MLAATRKQPLLPAPNVLLKAPQDLLPRRILLIKPGNASLKASHAQGANPRYNDVPEGRKYSLTENALSSIFCQQRGHVLRNELPRVKSSKSDDTADGQPPRFARPKYDWEVR